ncbi:CHRD domain-containing protein [Nitriliruptoraceae bacterium ZYF776]|nr:CHRD domain-containing protein [Profundirhabdus halotolerans]
MAQTPGTEVDEPSSFTSQWRVSATPDQVTEEDGERGNPDASGTYDLRFDSTQEIVCFDITVSGVNPPFESPAATANHIHQGFAGMVGDPVVLFPNPEAGSDGQLVTSGCLQEPFNDDAPISLADIESSPAGFYVDLHTEDFPRGDVRGQLTMARIDEGGADGGAAGADPDREAAMPAEGQGVAAGFGGAAGTDRNLPIVVAVLALALAGAATATALTGRRGA